MSDSSTFPVVRVEYYSGGLVLDAYPVTESVWLYPIRVNYAYHLPPEISSSAFLFHLRGVYSAFKAHNKKAMKENG